MTPAEIIVAVSAGDISPATAADKLEALGYDPVDYAGEIEEAAYYARQEIFGG